MSFQQNIYQLVGGEWEWVYRHKEKGPKKYPKAQKSQEESEWLCRSKNFLAEGNKKFGCLVVSVKNAKQERVGREDVAKLKNAIIGEPRSLM